MKRRFVLQLLAMVTAISSVTFLSSCDDDNDPEGAAPAVSINPTSATDKPGAVVTVTVSVTAPNGGKTLQISGIDADDVTLNGSNQQDVEVDITIPADASAGSTVTAVFIAIDKTDKASTPVEFPITVGDPLEILEGNITTNTSLDASKKYLIRGKVYVQAPATLTIPAGTILFGEKDSDGTLIINRGAKIDAQGTADNPIIMTSQAPKGFRNRGDWGGVVILGNAYNSNGASATIEGIQGEAGSENGAYGPGTGDANDADDSGIMRYVRIEFAGIALSQDNELNSLTMGSVGSGTTIDHIQVSYANDDAFEWFGGSVNHKYLIAYSTLDDDFDTDRGYNGKTQFGLIVRDPLQADFSGSRAWESSSNGNATPSTVGGTSRHSAPVFSNVTVCGPLLFRGSASINQFFRSGIEVNSNSAIQIHNSVITGFPKAATFATAGATVTNNIFVANLSNAADGASAPGDFGSDNTLEDDVTKIFGAFTAGSLYSFENAPLTQTTDSPYLTGATDLGDDFFDNVPFYGAFGTEAAAEWDFDKGWINFDPANEAY